MIGQAQKLVWAGGEHYFLFDIGHLRALEKSLDAGVAPILLRLLNGTWGVNDVLETLRLGMQGGGMLEKDALRAIESAYPSSNLYELSVTAARILTMFVAWPTGKGEDEPKDDPSGEAKAASSSETARPDGQPSSAPLQ